MVYRIYFHCVNGYSAIREVRSELDAEFSIHNMKQNDFVKTVDKVEIDLSRDDPILGDIPLCRVNRKGEFVDL